MFESLSDRLGAIVGRLRNRGRLTEGDVDEVLGEIRTALLEADVNVGVVRNVLARIREQAVGAAQSKALDPAQQVVKVVHAELVALLGGETLSITYASTTHRGVDGGSAGFGQDHECGETCGLV